MFLLGLTELKSSFCCLERDGDRIYDEICFENIYYLLFCLSVLNVQTSFFLGGGGLKMRIYNKFSDYQTLRNQGMSEIRNRRIIRRTLADVFSNFTNVTA